MHVCFNSWSDYAESLKLITIAVLLFWEIENSKSVLFKIIDNISLRAAIIATLWDGCPPYSMVKKWNAEFKRGREKRQHEG